MLWGFGFWARPQQILAACVTGGSRFILLVLLIIASSPQYPTWRFMGTHNPSYKSTSDLLRGLLGACKRSHSWGRKYPEPPSSPKPWNQDLILGVEGYQGLGT